MNDSITRRNALRTGGLAAIAAGLIGTTTTPPVDAQPASTPPALATVVNVADMSAECKRLSEALHASMLASCDEQDRMKELMSPEAYKLAIGYVEGIEARHNGLWLDLMIAELIRHLPGVAPAIRMAVRHIYDGYYEDRGVCCASGNWNGSL
jgi:hypothetical protein